jgi:hypothetical protein
VDVQWEKAAIETSGNENSRSQGSQGSCGRAVSITQPSSIIKTKDSSFSLPVVGLTPIHDSMIMPLPNSLFPVVAATTCQNNTKESSKKPKVRYTDDGRHDGVFWRIFDDLENSSPNGNKTVRGQELKARLVSSNKFFVCDAVLIIERMVRTGKICNVAFDTYCRKGENSN